MRGLAWDDEGSSNTGRKKPSKVRGWSRGEREDETSEGRLLISSNTAEKSTAGKAVRSAKGARVNTGRPMKMALHRMSPQLAVWR